MKKLSSKLDKIFNEFTVNAYHLSIQIANSENFDLLIKKDAKFIQKELLNTKVRKLVEKHNDIIFKLEDITNKKEFFKLLTQANDLWNEIDINLGLGNQLIKDSCKEKEIA